MIFLFCIFRREYVSAVLRSICKTGRNLNTQNSFPLLCRIFMLHNASA